MGEFPHSGPDRLEEVQGDDLVKIPKNLKVGDKIILFEVYSAIRCEYSKLTVKEVRRSGTRTVTYRIDGYVLGTGRASIPPSLRMPCNGVVYSDADYTAVQVIRGKPRVKKQEVKA